MPRTLKSLPIVTLLILQGASLVCQSADFRRSYEAQELSANQERAIVRLVRRIGITNIAEIHTSFMLPSDVICVTAIEADKTINDEASYREAWIMSKQASPAKPKKGAVMEGDYWIESVSRQKRLLFSVADDRYRVRPIGKVSAQQAADCLRILIAGRFEVAPGISKSDVEAADLKNVLSIEAAAQSYVLCCRSKNNQNQNINITLKKIDEHFRVVKVTRWDMPIP